jgi:phage shock protein PspC (stress-responsive transcriptional regulator)
MPSSNENAADKAIDTGLRESVDFGAGAAVGGVPRAAADSGRHRQVDSTQPLDEGEEAAEQTLLEQLGGFGGLIYSTLPVLVFVPVNSFAGLTAAIWAALGVASAILLWRLVRRSPIQPAVSGFFGVGICAFIAYRMGEAKGFFLFGIYTSLLYAGVFLVSMLVRWPLVGVIWGVLNGHGSDWRADRRIVRLYNVATTTWVLVFGARYLVQSQLYDSDHTGWLAAARIAMGWPLTAVALAVTVWAVRRAGHMPVRRGSAAAEAA